jgi:hypothetical protein
MEDYVLHNLQRLDGLGLCRAGVSTREAAPALRAAIKSKCCGAVAWRTLRHLAGQADWLRLSVTIVKSV